MNKIEKIHEDIIRKDYDLEVIKDIEFIDVAIKKRASEAAQVTKDVVEKFFMFLEDNYEYHHDSWHDRDTDEFISRKDLLNKFFENGLV